MKILKLTTPKGTKTLVNMGNVTHITERKNGSNIYFNSSNHETQHMPVVKEVLEEIEIDLSDCK